MRSPRVSWSRVALSRSEPNWANAASSRYCAMSSLSGPATLRIALVWARRAHARHRDADVEGRPHTGVEQVRLQVDLAVGDRDDVRRDIGRHVVRLGLDDRQRRQRATAVRLVRGARRAPAGGSAGRTRRPDTPRGRAGGGAAATSGDMPRRAWSGRRRRRGVLDERRRFDAVLHDLLAHGARRRTARGTGAAPGRRRRRRRRSCAPSRRTAPARPTILATVDSFWPMAT